MIAGCRLKRQDNHDADGFIHHQRTLPGRCLVGTEGNLNNELGVSLMLWKLRPEHQAACFEVGMNHIGEMRPLVSAIAPTIGTVTNTMRDHQEFLASLEETAKENGEVFAQLPRQGVAVINAADPFAVEWRKMAGNNRVVTFGTPDSDVYACEVEGTAFRLVTPDWPN